MKETIKSDEHLYRWYNFDMLVQEQGGNAFPSPAVIRGCKNIMADCVAKGPKFVRIAPDSKRVEFKKKSSQERHGSTDKWSDVQREYNAPSTSQGSAAAPADGAHDVATPPVVARQAVTETPPKTGAPVPKAAAAAAAAIVVAKAKAAAAKGKGKGKKGKVDKAKDAAPAKNRRGLAKHAKDIANKYGATMTVARHLMANIESDADFDWARSDRFQGRLERAIEQVDATVNEHADVKAAVTMGEDMVFNNDTDIHAEMTKLNKVGEKLDSLESQSKRIKLTAAEGLGE